MAVYSGPSPASPPDSVALVGAVDLPCATNGRSIAATAGVWVIRVVAVALVALTTVLAKVSELTSQNGVPTSDAGIFATIGSAIANGQVPYRDLWDHKPPGILYINAIVFGWLRVPPWDYHLFEIPLALLTAAAFYWLARSLAGHIAAIAGTLLFTFFYTAPSLSMGGDLTETYLPLVSILAVGLALRYWLLGEAVRASATHGVGFGTESRSSLASFYSSPWSLTLCGLSCGVAMLLKPQSVFDLLLVESLVFHRRLHRPGQRWARLSSPREIAVTFSPLLTAAGCLMVAFIPLLAMGAGEAMWSQLVVYNSLYSSAVSVPEAVHLLGTNGLGLLLWVVVAVSAAAAAPAVILQHEPPRPARNRGANSPRFRGSERRLASVLLCWAAIGVVETASDRHFWPHDFLMGLPSAALLATFTVRYVGGRLRHDLRPARLSGAMAASAPFVLVLTLTWTAVVASLLPLDAHRAADLSRLRLVRSRPEHGPVWSLTTVSHAPTSYGLVALAGWTLSMQASSTQSDDQRLAQAIVARTRPSESVFLWTQPLGTYVLSGREPASRFLYYMPLANVYGDVHGGRYATRTIDRQLMGDLAAHKPALVVVERRYASSMRLVPGLVALLRSSYRQTGVLSSTASPGGFTLYQRTPPT